MSTLQNLKACLKDALSREQELIDFCKEAIKEIFGDDAHEAQCMFDSFLEYFDDNGCIQGICCIKSNIENNKERSKKYREEQALKKAQEDV